MVVRIVRPVGASAAKATRTATAPLARPRLAKRLRPYSTAAPPSPFSSGTEQQQQQQQQPPPPKTRWVRPSTLLFLLLGAGLAFPTYRQVAKLTPTLPARGSPAEDQARAALEARAAQLPLVKELTMDPKWAEWTVGSRYQEGGDTDNTAAAAAVPPQGRLLGGDVVDEADAAPGDTSSATPRRLRLTRDGLGGVQGMTGYQRVFLDPATGDLVTVIHLGSALSGFPTRGHGGALATLLDESLGRCAIHSLPARTGVTARLELQYRRPVPLPGFYVVRCHPELPQRPDSAAAETAPELRKLWCSATLETLDGKTCVEARALFVVPRGYQLGRVEDRF